MRRFLDFLTTLSTRYTVLTLTIAMAIAIASIWYSFENLKFDTDQDHLISDKLEYYQTYKKFLKEFGDWEYIYVVVKPKPTYQGRLQAKVFANRLASKLNQRPDLFLSVVHRIEFDSLNNNLLLLASDKEFEEFTNFFGENKNSLQDFLNIKKVSDWYGYVNSLFDQNVDPEKEKHLEKYWPSFKHSLQAPFDNHSLNELKDTNLLTMLSHRYMDPDGYLFSENGKLLFLRILPKKDFSQMEIIAKPLSILRSTLDNLKIKFPDLEFGITGKPVLQNDEAVSTQSDSEWAGLAAFLLVSLLIFLTFRRFKRPLMALLALFIGISWTTGFVTLVFGQINLITIVFAIILIGLGIDYGIHFLSRYEQELLSNLTLKDAIKNTTKHTGRAILLGALTSATAFATALFTDFLGLQELGIIAGVGILLCCLAQLTVFPALIMVFGKSKSKNQAPRMLNCSRLEFLTKKPLLVLSISALVTLCSLPFVFKIGFDSNLLKLQDQKSESVIYENLIQNNTDFSTWFLAYQTKRLEDLKIKQEQVKKLSTVKRTESILDVLPQNPKKRIKKISALTKIFSKKDPTTKNHLSAFPDTIDTIGEMKKLKDRFATLANKALRSGLEEEFEELNKMGNLLDQQIKFVVGLKTPKIPFEGPFLSYLKQSQDLLSDILSPKPFYEAELPQNLLSIYKGKNGYYSLTIYPKNDIWDPQNMEEFISEVRTVIPTVTGAPITTYESAKRMINGFALVAFLTSLLVLLFVFLEFRNFSVPLLVYANLLLCFLWLGAFMYFKGISINLANFFALPVLIGTGIDHGIHIFHHFKETRSVKALYSSTVPAIIMSCLTTICGFGSLAFVRHQGLASFGLIMAVGTFIIMISSVILLPNVLALTPTKSE